MNEHVNCLERESVKREDLKPGMKVIDTDDGMIMEYEKTESSDFFVTGNNRWHTCQFDLSVFEPYIEKGKEEE